MEREKIIEYLKEQDEFFRTTNFDQYSLEELIRLKQRWQEVLLVNKQAKRNKE